MVRLALKRMAPKILLALRGRHHLCRTQVTTGNLPRSPVAIVFGRRRSTLPPYARVERVVLNALSETRGQAAYRFLGLASRCRPRTNSGPNGAQRGAYGRGGGVGRGRRVGRGLGVTRGVAVGVAVSVGVGLGVGVPSHSGVLRCLSINK